MNNYVIVTDSACDIKPTLLKEWGVEYVNMTFRFDSESVEYTNDDININDFYNRMRNGGHAKTAAVNPGLFTDVFEKILRQGRDILYVGFSSGLSTTYNSSCVAAEELKIAYPERKLITVDTLAASAGEGLLLYLAVQKKKEGFGIEEVADFIEKNKLNLCHWFTVDDLAYLKRGGRVSPTVAFVGTVLGIKPILHVDNEGHLVSAAKVRSRKTSIATLAEKYGQLAKDPKKGNVFISHGDCIKDAEELKRILKEKYGIGVDIITDIGPVIGAHSGPGTLALFFVGRER